MWMVNTFGRVVDVPEDDVKRKIKRSKFRIATKGEIARMQAHKDTVLATGDNSVFYSTVSATPDGYGMSRNHLVEELQNLGVMLKENYTGQKVGLLYNYPYSVVNMRSDVRLIYTMFESDKIPDDWVEYLKAADEVLVPSKWCQWVFKKSGVDSTVVPLGYNDRTFIYFDRRTATREGKPFTFIHYDSFNYRKGFKEIFDAFTQEFSADDNVELILKTVHTQTLFPILKSEYPKITVIKEEKSERGLYELLCSADCMVYPSRGEGFGITPLEAMATGMPAIVPNAHGISEYFHSDYMLEVSATERCPSLVKRFKGQDIGEMVVCDVDDLRRQMRYAYEHQDDVYELGKLASEYVKQFTYRKTAEKLDTVIKKWQKTNVVKRGDSKFLKVEVV